MHLIAWRLQQQHLFIPLIDFDQKFTRMEFKHNHHWPHKQGHLHKSKIYYPWSDKMSCRHWTLKMWSIFCIGVSVSHLVGTRHEKWKSGNRMKKCLIHPENNHISYLCFVRSCHEDLLSLFYVFTNWNDNDGRSDTALNISARNNDYDELKPF